MTTALQTQSNLRNAQHSTGPVTEVGQARSARNALKHGYYATDIVMPGEDGEQFARLLASVQTDWVPESDPERELTDEIAVALWRRRRLRRTEAELWAERCAGVSGASRERTASAVGASRERAALTAEEPRTLGQAFAEDSNSCGNAIEKLRRWWQGNERHLNRCQDKLALLKRLSGQMRRAPPPEVVREHNRYEDRELDLLFNAPPPGDVEFTPEEMADLATEAPNEIRNSTERTQLSNGEAHQSVTAERHAPSIPVTLQAALPGGLPRKERRALQRKLAKEQRRQEKLARQAAA